MVIWVIGLSGAGKTTLAKEVMSRAKKINKKLVHIDGDALREIFDNDLGHSIDDRKKNAFRICKLSKFISDQGVDVICSILSLFPETRDWNRKNINNYFEVYIDTPLDQLKKRDYKGLYAKYERGEIQNVAGLDIEFVPPVNSNMVIQNNKELDSLLKNAELLIKKICE